MAATAIALTKIPLNGGVELPATAALDGTAGAEIQFDGQDTKIVILIENGGSSAGDVTFKAGNGIQGVADLVVNVANGKTKAVVLESGAFKKAGKVYVTGAATMKAAALLLPEGCRTPRPRGETKRKDAPAGRNAKAWPGGGIFAPKNAPKKRTYADGMEARPGFCRWGPGAAQP